MVGFNRRFAPLAQEVKDFLAGRTTPLVMTFRVNAGYIPDDHWVHDPEVGRRAPPGRSLPFYRFSLLYERLGDGPGKRRGDRRQHR